MPAKITSGATNYKKITTLWLVRQVGLKNIFFAQKQFTIYDGFEYTGKKANLPFLI